MSTVLVACPTAQVKDYAFEKYFKAYKAMKAQAIDAVDLFMVDTTPDTEVYRDKLLACDIEAVHMQPPYWPRLDCLVYTVNKAWEIIVAYAWEREYDYILSLESDIIAPPETIDTMMWFAEENGAVLVQHSYPYIGYDAKGGIHSLGCTLFKRTLFAAGESLHEPKNPNIYEIGGGGNFEDMIEDKPRAFGMPTIKLANFLHLEHWQTEELPYCRHTHE